jgi:hypothetical protein
MGKRKRRFGSNDDDGDDEGDEFRPSVSASKRTCRRKDTVIISQGTHRSKGDEMDELDELSYKDEEPDDNATTAHSNLKPSGASSSVLKGRANVAATLGEGSIATNVHVEHDTTNHDDNADKPSHSTVASDPPSCAAGQCVINVEPGQPESCFFIETTDPASSNLTLALQFPSVDPEAVEELANDLEELNKSPIRHTTVCRPKFAGL